MAKTTYAKGIHGMPILAERAKNTYTGVSIDEKFTTIDNSVTELTNKTETMTSAEFSEILAILGE